MASRTVLRSVAAAALATAALVIAPGAASAAIISVPCNVVALQAAISTADAAPGSSTLNLATNCTYRINVPSTAATGLPMITGQLTINGNGATITRGGAAPHFRLMDIAGGADVTLLVLKLSNGNTTGLGGAIQSAGTLTVSNATLSGNTASNGGALSVSAGGTASVSGSTLDDNTTTGVGGGAAIVFGQLSLVASKVTDNQAPINGGGVNVQPGGTATLRGSVVTGNTSGSLGGGLSNLGVLKVLAGTLVQHNTGSAGGGIATGNGDVTVSGASVTLNTPDNCSPLNTIPGCTG